MANKKQYIKKLNDHENEMLDWKDFPSSGIITTVYNQDTGDFQAYHKEDGPQTEGDPGNNGNPIP